MAELVSPLFKDEARLIRKQRRQRILPAARRFKYIAAFDLTSFEVSSLARYAKLVLRAIVKKL